MEEVSFLGITFRSVQHAMWFKLTMGVLLISLLASGGLVHTQHCSAPGEIWKSLVWFSFGTSLLALFHTKGGTINGPVYSVDCIWYNALLGGIYLGLTIFAKAYFG